ncbi:hypothetical protein [Paractinoplanes hotanensis]|uniref:Lipoprotein n=1 Tax=Paractinoplanes hotanensis TaxID=2906497 RepID=A0ABT0YCW0_9ACTN|nr:hypothetical protein [Actinoplanes hotanensis]MCM4083888.1 hypothetical protein [Actinoplanes hotanensis]
MNKKVLACFTAAGLLLTAGCGDDDPTPAPDVSATGEPAPTSAAPAADVAACAVGQWRSTGLPAAPDGGAADADLTGGAGFQVAIVTDGDTAITFDGMDPVVFSARLGEAEVSGKFTYSGRATGTMTTNAGSGTSPSPATSGTWQPVGDINWDQTRLTVDLTEPASARVFDNVPLEDYTGDGAARTGDAVDIDPFFDAGTYTCDSDTLTITPNDDGDLPIVLERV